MTSGVVVGVALLVGCGPSPEAVTAQAWLDGLQPVQLDERLYQEDLIDAARRAAAGLQTPERNLARWERSAALATHVAEQLRQTARPADYGALHDELVELWARRAAASRRAAQAWREADEAAWAAARAELDAVHLALDTWRERANAHLNEVGVDPAF